MKKSFMLLLLILNVTITSCFGVSWVKLDDNNFIDKDSIKFYVDDYGNVNYHKRVFWTKYEGNGIYQEIEKMTGSKIEYGLAQFIIDYSNNTMALKAGMTYDKDGKPVSSYSYQDFQLKYNSIAPNSNAELWADLIKRPKVLKKIYKFQQSNLNNN